MAGFNFTIKSGNDNFASKQKSLFDVLDNAEKDVKLPRNESPMEVDPEDPIESKQRKKKIRSRTKSFRGQESLFKVPATNIMPFRPRVPYFRRNPQRWTKYTLADVNPEDLSDASNTAAAMDFLRSVRPEPVSVEETQPQKVTFNRSKQRKGQRQFTQEEEVEVDSSQKSPTKTKQRIGFGDVCMPVEEASSEKASFREGKLVMPEYVVGEKIVKAKKVKKQLDRGKELALSHLLDQEEEEA